MVEFGKHSASAKQSPFPEAPVPAGVRTLSPDEIASFLLKFPARDQIGIGVDTVGVAVDMRGDQITRYFFIMLSMVFGAALWVANFLRGEHFWWILLASALIATLCGASMLVNKMITIIHSGSIYFYSHSGFFSSRRVIHPGDMLRIVRVEHKSREPDPRHTVELSLVKQGSLFFFDARHTAACADWFVELLRMHLGLPVESALRYDIGSTPPAEPDPAQLSVPEKEDAPQKELPSFPEFDILLPGMPAYEQFHRKVHFSPDILMVEALSGFLIREKAITNLFSFEKKRFFFTPGALLICKRSGEITVLVRRNFIEEVNSKNILSGGIFTDAREDWHISLKITGMHDPIPLLSLRNVNAAKCFVDTVRTWVAEPER